MGTKIKASALAGGIIYKKMESINIMMTGKFHLKSKIGSYADANNFEHLIQLLWLGLGVG